MAVSDSFLTFVLEQLDGVRRVTHRRMFGGVGLYSDQIFFALLDDDRLYFKVDETTVSDYKRAGMGPFRPDPSQPMTMKYFEVPLSVFEDRDELAKWASKAIRVAEGSKGSTVGRAGLRRAKVRGSKGSKGRT